MDRLASDLYMFREFGEALEQCIRFVHFADPGELAFCIGPSGAGKTRLSEILGERIYGPQASWPRQTTPFIRVIADNPDRGFFSSKELARSMVGELRDPFRANALRMEGWDLKKDTKDRLVNALGMMKAKRLSEPEMREVVQSVGAQRQLQLIIVDEANMLALTYQRRTPTDYVESLRTLGKKSGARIILFGTMDMLELRGFSAQLNRSVSYIHIDRMRCDDLEGRREFLGMLKVMEERWGVECGALLDNSDDVFDWTYGIPGEVDSLLKRAAIKSKGGEKLAWQAIVKGRKSEEEIERMRSEADLVYGVLNNEPLTPSQEKVLIRRRKSRMRPRRIPAQGA